MHTSVALFRSINVGGNNLLPMAALITILEEVGCSQVKTYIQSGNVTFKTPKKLSKRKVDEIISLIKIAHSFTPIILLLQKSELEAAIDANPYNPDEGKALHFYFLESKPEHPDMDTLRPNQSSAAASEAVSFAV